MENSKVTRSWGVAVAIIAAVVCIAAAALTLTTMAKAQQPAACCPAVVIQWQPQSILEAKFRARILEDNASILKGLQAIADNPKITEKEMDGYVGMTYFRVPRLLTDKGWIEGWPQVLPALKELIKPGSRPAITSVSVVINYQPYAGAKLPEDDIDALAKIQFTFSASPDGRTAAGDLKHSRVCEVI
jgi:hypothetical protein